MTQLTLLNGGVTSLDYHEVSSYPLQAGQSLPAVPAADDATTIETYLVSIKMIELPGAQ